MGEDGSFLMELLKIASSNQIRSIKILSVSVADLSKTEDSKIKTETQKQDNNTGEGTVFPKCP